MAGRDGRRSSLQIRACPGAAACRPRARAAFLVATAAFLAALAASAAEAAGQPSLKSPSPAAIARGPARIPDTLLTTGARRLEAARTYWGGTFTAFTGETVTIHVSSRYPQDDSRAQHWADFLAGLVHGPELSRLTVYLAPLDEVQSICGEDALACYSPQDQLMVAPGDDPSPDLSAEAVVTHEYGHHIAANRSNAPWAAVDYGTKRWATYIRVCSRTASGELHPGAESASDYQTNPGEAFAESYRVLNERQAGLPEAPWNVVSLSLYPDDTALALLSQDVTSPWTADASSALAGTVAKRAKAARSFSVSTPLDGTFAATLRVPRTLAATLTIYSGARRLASAATSGGSASVTTTVCGARSLRLAVTRRAGSGPFRIALATP